LSLRSPFTRGNRALLRHEGNIDYENSLRARMEMLGILRGRSSEGKRKVKETLNSNKNGTVPYTTLGVHLVVRAKARKELLVSEYQGKS